MGSQKLVESITENQLRDADFFPDFHVGDTINVHYTIDVEDSPGVDRAITDSDLDPVANSKFLIVGGPKDYIV